MIFLESNMCYIRWIGCRWQHCSQRGCLRSLIAASLLYGMCRRTWSALAEVLWRSVCPDWCTASYISRRCCLPLCTASASRSFCPVAAGVVEAVVLQWVCRPSVSMYHWLCPQPPACPPGRHRHHKCWTSATGRCWFSCRRNIVFVAGVTTPHRSRLPGWLWSSTRTSWSDWLCGS